jgi:hypothetical protein
VLAKEDDPSMYQQQVNVIYNPAPFHLDVKISRHDYMYLLVGKLSFLKIGMTFLCKKE